MPLAIQPQNPQTKPNVEVPQKECSIVTEFEVGYKEDILPIIETNCKLCHSAGAFNWMDYQTLSAAKAKVLTRVFDQQNMPPRGMKQPSSEELATLKKWLQIGTPESKKIVDNSNCPQQENPAPEAPVIPEPPPAPIEPPPVEPANITYEKDIKPILDTYCMICHSAGDLNWGLYDSLKLRAQNGVLFDRLFTKQDMPMAGFAKPNPDQYEILRQWIDTGALEK